MRIVVYGVGKRFEKSYDDLCSCKIVALSDNDSALRGTKRGGYEIVPPKRIAEYSYDFVVVTPANRFEEISSNLIFESGLKAESIISLDYFLNVLKENKNENLEDRNQIVRFLYGQQFKLNAYQEKVRNFKGVDMRAVELQDVCNYRGELIDYSPKHDVTFYTVFHKAYRYIDARGYCSIAVGDKKHDLKCDYSDDSGENIAIYNNLINEATALFWIWKNDTSPIVGLNHYRRYLSSPFCEGWPLQGWEADLILQKYDVIVAEHIWYKNETVLHAMQDQVCRDALEQSFPAVRKIVRDYDINYVKYFDDMTNGQMLYPCEMFVMRRELLNEYCQWLFPIVFKMIENVKINEKWDDYSKRIIGFWTERLLTVWLMSTDYSVFELPIILLEENSGTV